MITDQTTPEPYIYIYVSNERAVLWIVLGPPKPRSVASTMPRHRTEASVPSSLPTRDCEARDVELGGSPAWEGVWKPLLYT